MKSNILGLVVACSLTNLGCSAAANEDANLSDNGEPNNVVNAEPGTTYYGDVKPILDAHCTSCHVEGGIGPFALTTFDDVAAVASLVASAVESRAMPPFLAAPAVRPLKYDASLSDAQIATIRSWVDAGTPSGDMDNPGEVLTREIRELSQVDLTIAMASAHTPSTSPDEYRCFVIEWPLDEPKYVTGLNVRPGNLKIAHHAVPYLIDPESASVVDAADGADGISGYPCFGGAIPPGADAFPTKIISAWVPGEAGQDFPEGTGVLVRPGSRIVLQMHYSTVEANGPDQSQVDFRLADAVEHDAGNLPWLDIGWPSNPESMLIPAGADDVVHEWVGDPTQAPLMASFVPGLDPSEGIVMHSVLPHMHKLGKSVSMQVERQDGTVEPVLDISRWDFDWQGYYEFAEPITLLPGDQLRLRCEFDNTMQNQPLVSGERRAVADVMWGEGTYDEMCAASIYIHGVAEGSDTSCAEFASTPADQGRFSVTFDGARVMNNANLEGELRGPVELSVYRAEDVTGLGPKDGATPVQNFSFDDIDLRNGPAGPFELDFDFPAGSYQFLGFMDTDGNAADNGGGPDVNDPVMIPLQATDLRCARQDVVVEFPILLPNI